MLIENPLPGDSSILLFFRPSQGSFFAFLFRVLAVRVELLDALIPAIGPNLDLR